MEVFCRPHKLHLLVRLLDRAVLAGLMHSECDMAARIPREESYLGSSLSNGVLHCIV